MGIKQEGRLTLDKFLSGRYSAIMNTIIITNNPKVEIEFFDRENVEYVPEADQTEILRRARDLVHLGARLIIHPMAGRIKPHETPYKSVFLEAEQGVLDITSLTIIEDSIAETNKFLEGTYRKKYDEQLLPDLQFIDLQLLKNGVEEYRRSQ